MTNNMQCKVKIIKDFVCTVNIWIFVKKINVTDLKIRSIII